MQSSQKLIAKILKYTRNDQIAWNAQPSIIERFWRKINQKLDAYIKGAPDFVSVEDCSSRLTTWYETLYQAEVLEKEIYNPASFALTAHYAYWYILCNEPLANDDRGGLVLENDAAYCWSLQVIAGWSNRAAILGDVLLKGLDTPLLKGGSSLFPHFWFVMHLYTRWRSLPAIDTDLYSYPSAKKMAVYDAVLDNWQTRDVQQVTTWCIAMAEHHIRNAWEPDADSVREFGRARARLYPYEIFAYLRLREWLKLPNPAQQDLKHPLFEQPLGRYMPSVPGPIPGTPVLDAALQRYKREYPGLRMG